MNSGTAGTVVSASGGRFAILAALGFGDLVATVFLIIYLVSPESLGPAYNRPGADTLLDVAALFLVMWGLSAFAWAVIAREVSIRDDQVFVTRGTGRKTTLSRADIKSFHAFPFRNWYVVWMSCRPGAPIGRSIFFSHSPDLPAWPQASAQGGTFRDRAG